MEYKHGVLECVGKEDNGQKSFQWGGGGMCSGTDNEKRRPSLAPANLEGTRSKLHMLFPDSLTVLSPMCSQG